MSAADLPLVRRWLATPEVTQWWGDSGAQFELVSGDLDMIDRGHGAAFIRMFVNGLLAAAVPRVVTDPDPANARAIRAYEKAGFERDRMVEMPDGPAILMVRNGCDLS